MLLRRPEAFLDQLGDVGGQFGDGHTDGFEGGDLFLGRAFAT
jgi:hypothetical protein